MKNRSVNCYLNNATERVKNSKRHYIEARVCMCDEWKNDFMAFYRWVMKNGYSSGLELDRINNDLGYSPENCRFVTHSKNMRNTSRAKSVRVYSLMFDRTFESIADAADFLADFDMFKGNSIVSIRANICKALKKAKRLGKRSAIVKGVIVQEGE